MYFRSSYKKSATLLSTRSEKSPCRTGSTIWPRKYSRSLVLHSRFYLKSILDEAVEQNYLLKNQAKKLGMPEPSAGTKPFSPLEQI